MLPLDCPVRASGAGAKQPAAGPPCPSDTGRPSRLTLGLLGPNSLTPQPRSSSRSAQLNTAPPTVHQCRGHWPAMPRRAALLAISTGMLWQGAAPSTTTAAPTAAKLENLSLAALQKIIVQDFTEVRQVANGAQTPVSCAFAYGYPGTLAAQDVVRVRLRLPCECEGTILYDREVGRRHLH